VTLSEYFANKQIRFVIVGGINFAWGLASYPVLYWVFHPLGVNYLVVLAIAYAINTLFSFATQKYIVFQTQDAKAHFELLRFAGFQALLFGANLVILPLLVYLGGHPVVMQTVWTFCVSVAGYFFHDKVTFKSQSKN